MGTRGRRPRAGAARRRRFGGGERRRDHRPIARHRERAAGSRTLRLRAGGARRPRDAGGRRVRPVRLPVPRVRRAGPPASELLAAEALAPLAATPALGPVARGREAVPDLPDHPRDAARVPAGRLRPPGSRPPRARAAVTRDPHRRDHDRSAVALRPVPALRLRRRVHVRGRQPARRAPGCGSRGRQHDARRVARSGGAPRTPRPRRHRADRPRTATTRPGATTQGGRGCRRRAADARSAHRGRDRGPHDVRRGRRVDRRRGEPR